MFIFVLLFAAICVAPLALLVYAWNRLARLERHTERLTARLLELESWQAAMGRWMTMPTTSAYAPGREEAAPSPAPSPAPLPAPPPVPSLAPTPRAVTPPPVLQPPLPPREPAPPRPAADALVRAATLAEKPEASNSALEMLIGGRWLLYAGVVVVIVGIALLEKLAIDSHWLSETARVLQGTAAGVALLGGGLYFARKGLRVYGQLMAGAGIAALYLSTYAAFSFYGLIEISTAIALMSLVTVLAASVASHLASEGLALVAICGGFATPFLIGVLGSNPTGLFSYNTLLIAGAVLLSRRHDWVSLNLASYALTIVSTWAWLSLHYTPGWYLATELFLTLFCAMFLVILGHTHRSSHHEAPLARNVLWSAPALYYIVSLGILMPHTPAVLIFLLLAGGAGLVVSVRFGSVARLSAALLVMMPLIVWTGDLGIHRSLWSGLSTWAALYVMYVVSLIHGDVGRDKPFGHASIALLHFGGLVPFAGVYVLLARGHAEHQGPLAAVLSVLNVGLGVMSARRNRETALHFIALAATLLTIAMALVLDGAWRTNALAVEAALLIFLGLRERRDWIRGGGLLLFGSALIHLLWLQFGVDPDGDEWLFMNARAMSGLLIVTLTYVIAALHHRMAQPRERAIATATGIVLANVLTLMVLSSEIHARWFIQTYVAPAPGGAIPRHMLLSIGWASYAVGLILVGFRTAYSPLRYLGLAVFTVTVAKVGTIDLARLERTARVASTLGLGVALLAASYLYNRLTARVERRT